MDLSIATHGEWIIDAGKYLQAERAHQRRLFGYHRRIMEDAQAGPPR